MHALADSIDFLIDFRPMVVTFLTGSRHRILDATRMPGANASDLSQALVRLSGQFLHVPSRHDTLEPAPLGHSDNVDHFVLDEYLIDGYLQQQKNFTLVFLKLLAVLISVLPSFQSAA